MNYSVKSKCIFLFSWIFFIPLEIYAQNPKKAELVGKVRDDLGNTISDATIYNQTQGEILYSGLQGNFRMKVSAGDTLSLLAVGHDNIKYIVPFIENPFLFEDFTISFNRKAALELYNQQKSHETLPAQNIDGQHSITLAGRVVSANGDALVSANIRIGDSTKGAVTNKNGVYTLQVAAGDSVYFSFMGHKPQAIFVEGSSSSVVMKDVMLVPTAFMLQGVKVTANKALLNLDYDKTKMDAGEAARYTIRNQAMQTDKTYFPTVGLSTASFGGLSGIFGSKNKVKKVSQKVLDRQAIMRKKVLEKESQPDSIKSNEGNL